MAPSNTGEDEMKRFLTMALPLLAAVAFAGAGFAHAEEAPAATPCARAAEGGCPHAAKKVCSAAAEKKGCADKGVACADCPCKDGKVGNCADCPCAQGDCTDCPWAKGDCTDCPCAKGDCADCPCAKGDCAGCKKMGNCPRKAGS